MAASLHAAPRPITACAFRACSVRSLLCAFGPAALVVASRRQGAAAATGVRLRWLTVASGGLGVLSHWRMAPRQVTLKYVKGQSTLGKFFGAKNPPSQPQQTKLAFATKSAAAPPPPVRNTGEESKDASVVEQLDPEPPSGDEELRKRGRSPGRERGRASRMKGTENKVKSEEEEDEDEGPVVKRARRIRVKEEEDEDEGEEEAEKKGRSGRGGRAGSREREAAVLKREQGVASESKKEKSAVPKKKDGRDVKQIKSPVEPIGVKRETSPTNMDDDGKVGDDDEPRASASASASESASDAEDVGLDEKPIIAAKARQKVQTQLKTKTENHAYPDWKAGSPVPYAALCATFSLIEMTTKRLIIMEHCSLFLRQVMRLTPDDLLPTVLLMINKLAPDYAGIELGIGESLIMKAIGETTGRSLQVIKADQKEIGDLGLVAVKSRSTQPTMVKPQPLTVRGVHKGLMAIATLSGNGAQGKKVDGIKKLLSAADAYSTTKADITKDKGGPSEAKYIVRFLEGKLRLGLADRTVLVSLAHAIVCHEADQKGSIPSTTDMEKGESILKTVYSELPSYDAIIPAVLEHGIARLRENCKLRPGVPLKPMLAKPTKAITEVLDRFDGQTFTCEYKYDGERAQIHYVAKDAPQELSQETAGVAKAAADGVASIFSRNSEDLSKKYPDILAKLHTWVKNDTKSFVLDCETVAWDVKEKKVLPFQQLMTRKKKDVKLEDVKVKVCVFAFDLLYLNGKPVVEQPLRERRELLHQSFSPIEGEFAFATSMDGQELDEIQVFLDESVKASCEGLMVKMLDGRESGYEPSK
ncbi:hypothetical protein E4U53_001135, partial [Claviceps sorghi]